MPAFRLPHRSRCPRLLAAVLGALLAGSLAHLPTIRGAEEGESAAVVRTVQVPARGKAPQVVVTEFFTQGELRPDGRNLAVRAGTKLVPWRLLQVGPGDFCRVAFRTVKGVKVYKIAYGGPAVEKSPPWPDGPGLLLETRRWRWCDPNSLDAVRKALETAELIGSDFVPTVFHRYNPFCPNPEPFLSVYRGTLRVDVPGKYLFFTSSQDCSFLLVDGKQVVAAPGAHGPVPDARIKGETRLTAGPHRFEYFHVAGGADACMVAGWQPPRTTTPRLIPAESFGASEVAHLPAGRGMHRTRGALPDFDLEVLGEVPLADSREPLVRVRFTAAGAPRAGSIHWDFGDGQASDQPAPLHVYMFPGLYTVKLTVGGAKTGVTAVNRVQIFRAVVLPGPKHSPDELAHYLAIFQHYDTARFSPRELLQLVRAYDQLGQQAKVARLGKAGLLADEAGKDEESAYALAKLVGPLLRDNLDDPAGALETWRAAAKVVSPAERKAECELEAADIALNDLLQAKEARVLLESAAARISKQRKGSILEGRLHALWGDWYARAGDRKAARSSYARAVAALGPRGSPAEQHALRGALSRSTEAFLRGKELDRARDELRRWLEAFPEDRLEGYQSLLLARYHAAREKYPQVLAVADDLVVLNPESPYADRLVFLAAECAEKMGRPDRARAGYQTLLTDYPGSPLVPTARERLARLKGDKVPAPSK